MFTPIRSRAQRIATASIEASQSTTRARGPCSRTFATTSPCQSKIGSAPLSIPPGVTFKVTKPTAKGARTQPMSTVQIKGPLGELSMALPPYVNIDENPRLSGPTVSVQDSTDAKQRAMWGT